METNIRSKSGLHLPAEDPKSEEMTLIIREL
jgi:hypothetical protein